MFKVHYNPRLVPMSRIETDIELLKEPDFLCLAGSRLFGTDTEDSDIDIRGFTFLPSRYLLGIERFEQHQSLLKEDDVVIWAVDKFLRMVMKGSTMAFEMLFCPQDKIFCMSSYAESIVINREKFISKRLIKSILGYAENEFRRVTGETTRKLGKKRKDDLDKVGYKVGYSYKNAYHALRILDQGIELVQDRTITFPSRMNVSLLAIKEKRISIRPVLVGYELAMEKLEALLHSCDLPEEVDTKFVNDLLCGLYKQRIIKIDWS